MNLFNEIVVALKDGAELHGSMADLYRRKILPEAVTNALTRKDNMRGHEAKRAAFSKMSARLESLINSTPVKPKQKKKA